MAVARRQIATRGNLAVGIDDDRRARQAATPFDLPLAVGRNEMARALEIAVMRYIGQPRRSAATFTHLPGLRAASGGARRPAFQPSSSTWV
jgi:hypothetical protein